MDRRPSLKEVQMPRQTLGLIKNLQQMQLKETLESAINQLNMQQKNR